MSRAAEWEHVWSECRERNAPMMATVCGRRYKLYPSGRLLCAGTRPYHIAPPDGEPCPQCDAVSGGTIARLTVPAGER